VNNETLLWLSRFLGVVGFLGSLTSMFAALYVKNLFLRGDLSLERLKRELTALVEEEARRREQRCEAIQTRLDERFLTRIEGRYLQQQLNELKQQRRE
jgi:hypothetical protein